MRCGPSALSVVSAQQGLLARQAGNGYFWCRRRGETTLALAPGSEYVDLGAPRKIVCRTALCKVSCSMA